MRVRVDSGEWVECTSVDVQMDRDDLGRALKHLKPTDLGVEVTVTHATVGATIRDAQDKDPAELVPLEILSWLE